MKAKKLIVFLFSLCIVISCLILPFTGCKQEVVQQKTRLTLGESSLHRTQNILMAYGDYTLGVLGRVYEPLTLKKTDGTLIPCLAKSWEYSESTLTWTFHLDERAKWSDGKPVTAEDVKFTVEKGFEVSGPPTADMKGYIESIVAADERTVKFKLKESRGSLAADLVYVLIVPKHLWENIKDLAAETNPNPVGSGPFLWKEYVEQSHVLLAKNDKYWAGVPIIDEFLIKLYGTAEAAILALKTGEIDMLRSVNLPAMVATLIEEPNIKVGLTEPGHTNLLYLNHRFAPNNVIQFRQAIDAAIDRQAIIDLALAGYGKIPAMVPSAPVGEIVPEVAWKYKNKTQTERLALANSMLDSLGYAKGSDGIRVGPAGKIEFELLTNLTPSFIRTADLIKETMNSLGIKINVKTMDVKVMVGTLFSGKKTTGWQWALQPTPNRGLDTWVSEWGDDPYDVFFNSAAVGWKDDPTQSLMRQARRASGTSAINLYKQAQIKFAEQLPIIGLWNDVIIHAYRTDRFTNWKPTEDYFGLPSTANLIGLKPI